MPEIAEDPDVRIASHQTYPSSDVARTRGVGGVAVRDVADLGGQRAAGPSARRGEDRVDLSAAALAAYERASPVVEAGPEAEAGAEAEGGTQPGAGVGPSSTDDREASELSDAERDEVEQLEARDLEVRRHEMAHAAAGGQYAGSPVYEYQNGPDGKRYAVGGHVNIDVGEVSGDPEKTIEKMRVVRSAALAPAEPSGQDRKVAAEAAKKEAAAHAELAEQRSAGTEEPAGEAGGEAANARPSLEGPAVLRRARGRVTWQRAASSA